MRSKREAAHFTYVEEVDCTELVALRARANARLAARGIKLSFLPFIIKATVEALEKFPQLNATLDEAAGEIVQRRQLPHRPGHRDRRRADRAGGSRRRPAVDRRAGARDRAAGRRSPGGQGGPRGARRVDLHHHQPGGAGRRAGDAHHQLSRGRRSWACTRSPSARRSRERQDRDPRPDEPVDLGRSPGRRRLRRRAVRRGDQGDAGSAAGLPSEAV